MALEASKTIGTFGSWNDVAQEIISLAGELDSLCRATTLLERRQFVYGGLTALNLTDKWDQLRQGEDTEQSVLWMFTQLFVR